MQWPVEPSYSMLSQLQQQQQPQAGLSYALEAPFLAPSSMPQPLLPTHRNNERELQLEAAVSEAVRFVSNLLANRVPRRRVQGLGEQLLASLIAHLAVPNRPARVIIKTGAPVGPDGVQLDYVDQCVSRAIENAGLDVREVVSFLPDSLQLILEENEESLCLLHRQGDQGAAKPLFKARYTSSLRVPPPPASGALFQHNLLVMPQLPLPLPAPPPPPLLSLAAAGAHQPLLSRTISLPGPMSVTSSSGGLGLSLPPCALSPAAHSDSGPSLEPLGLSLPLQRAPTPGPSSAPSNGESLFTAAAQQPPPLPSQAHPALALAALPGSTPATLERLAAMAPADALALKRSSNGFLQTYNEHERAAAAIGNEFSSASAADASLVALISSLDLASFADDCEPNPGVSQSQSQNRHEQRALPVAPLQSEPPFLVKYAPQVACTQSSAPASDRLLLEAPPAAAAPAPKPPAYFCSATTWQPALPAAATLPQPQPLAQTAPAGATYDAWSSPFLTTQAAELVQTPTASQEMLPGPQQQQQQRQLYQETEQVPSASILPTLPTRSSCGAAIPNDEQSSAGGVVYTAVDFAATKFGSTKLRLQPRRPNHMVTRALVLTNSAVPQRAAAQAQRFPPPVAAQAPPRLPPPYRKLSSENNSPLVREFASAPAAQPPPLPARTHRQASTGTNSAPQTAYPQHQPKQPSFKSFSNFPIDSQPLWQMPSQYEPPPVAERVVTQHNLGPIGSPVPVAQFGSNAAFSDGADSGIDGPVVMRPRQPFSQAINAEASRGANSVQQKKLQQQQQLQKQMQMLQQPQASLSRMAQLDQPAQRSSAPARIGAPPATGGGPGAAGGGGPLFCAEQLDWGIGSLPANATNPYFPGLVPAASSGTSSIASDFFPPPPAFATPPFNYE